MKINEIDTDLEPGRKLGLNPGQSDYYLELVKTNCSESLSAIKTAGFLYRGIGNNSAPNAFKGRSREDRRSLSALHREQNAFNELVTYYGFKANRSNSIFCSGDKYQAKTYGIVHLIFPANGFNFLWSPAINDFWAQAEPIYQNSMAALYSEDAKTRVPEIIKGYNIKDDDLVSAIQSKNEILINGSYYAFKYDQFAEIFYKNFINEN